MHSIHLSHTDQRGADPVSTMRSRYLVVLFIALLLSACSKGGSGHGTGGISFSLKMPSQEASMLQYKSANIACVEYGIVTVDAQVHNSQENMVATGGPWPCDTGEGTIGNIEEGDGYIISLSLKDDQGNVILHGSKGGIQVIAGQTTEAGDINLISNVNRPPVLAPIGTQHFTLLSPGSITLSATDPDGDTLTYDVAGMPDPFGLGYLRGSSINPNTHVFTWDPGSNDYSPGEYKALIRVIDNGTPMLCDYEWVTIQVYNSPTDIDGHMYPVLATIGSKQTSVGQTLQFTISATDADPIASLIYSADPLPSGSSFSMGTRQFMWSSPGPAGNYKVRFIANDNHDTYNQQQVFEDVVITVGTVNRPPVLDPIGARDVAMGNTLQFVVTATDPENNLLTYSADLSKLPPGNLATFNPTTQTFSWSIPPYDGTIPHSTICTVRFTVTDNGSPQESDYEDVAILVE